MTLIDLATYLGSIAVGITSIGVIWKKLIVPFRSTLRKISEMHQEILHTGEFRKEAREFMLETRSTLDILQKHVGDTSIHLDNDER